MTYNWQQTDWPNFKYNLKDSENLLFDFAEKVGRISGFLEGLSEDAQTEAMIDTMVSEAIKTSEIEGEYLSRKDVMSSIRNNLGLAKNIEQVLRIIETHSMSEWERLETLEEKIIWDADKLDGLGAIGLARAFHMRGETGLPFHDFSWFKDDTLIRFERLNTDTAKEIGLKRIEFMKDFFEKLEDEITQA